jgi:uncharacterized BrkB/YihY/UPF0761 family membrane protein
VSVAGLSADPLAILVVLNATALLGTWTIIALRYRRAASHFLPKLRALLPSCAAAGLFWALAQLAYYSTYASDRSFLIH